jgi:hypothetical protein
MLSTLGMDLYFPKEAPQGFSSFIVAFEFIRSPADLETCINQLTLNEIHKLDIGNYIDFVFIFFYGLFLFYFFRKARILFDLKWLKSGQILTILIILFDLLENMMLLKITSVIEISTDETVLMPLIRVLHFSTTLKWFTLALVFFMISVLLFQKSRELKTLAITFTIPIIIAFVGNMQHPLVITIFTGAVFVSFLILIAFCLFFRNKNEMT